MEKDKRNKAADGGFQGVMGRLNDSMDVLTAHLAACAAALRQSAARKA